MLLYDMAGIVLYCMAQYGIVCCGMALYAMAPVLFYAMLWFDTVHCTL